MTDNTESNDTNKSDWKEREIGALWKREGKNQRFLSGKITLNDEVVNVVVYVNKFKEKDNQPDFRIYKDRPMEQTASDKPKETAEDIDADLPAVLQ